MTEKGSFDHRVGCAFIYAGAKQNGQSFRLGAAVPGEAYERAVENFINCIRFGTGMPASAPPPLAQCN